MKMKILLFVSCLNFYSAIAPTEITSPTATSSTSVVASTSVKKEGTFTSIISVLRTPFSFSTMLASLKTAKFDTGVFEKHGHTDDLTLFAPTDSALSNFGLLGTLATSEEQIKFWKYHIIKGRWDRKKIKNGRSARTHTNAELPLKTVPKILCSMEADNGIIHVIDGVLLHPEIQSKITKIKRIAQR